MADSDEEYEIPLRDQRYFGAGLKRKRVHFVPSSDASRIRSITRSQDQSDLTASERYLSIVFRRAQSEPAALTQLDIAEPIASEHQGSQVAGSCAVCRFPILGSDKSNPHESSVAHQVCLPHTHPPSALDRRRKGISILQAYGWDPDKRRGLGAAGEGILHPIQPKEKRDTIGLGVGTSMDSERSSGRKKGPEAKKPVTKLHAGKVKKLELEGKRKDERLRQMFYSNDEVEKYLGGG